MNKTRKINTILPQLNEIITRMQLSNNSNRMKAANSPPKSSTRQNKFISQINRAQIIAQIRKTHNWQPHSITYPTAVRRARYLQVEPLNLIVFFGIAEALGLWVWSRRHGQFQFPSVSFAVRCRVGVNDI